MSFVKQYFTPTRGDSSRYHYVYQQDGAETDKRIVNGDKVQVKGKEETFVVRTGKSGNVNDPLIGLEFTDGSGRGIVVSASELIPLEGFGRDVMPSKVSLQSSPSSLPRFSSSTKMHRANQALQDVSNSTQEPEERKPADNFDVSDEGVDHLDVAVSADKELEEIVRMLGNLSVKAKKNVQSYVEFLAWKEQTKEKK